MPDYRQERYKVRRGQFRMIINVMNARGPTLDCFADRNLHICPRCWGPSGLQADAFRQPWGYEEQGLPRMNPLYSRMSEVTAKLLAEKVRYILIAPNWSTTE